MTKGRGTRNTKRPSLADRSLDARSIRNGLARLGLEGLYGQPFTNAQDFASRFRRCSVLRDNDTSYSTHVSH